MLDRTKLYDTLYGLKENVRILELELDKPYISHSNLLAIGLRVRILANRIASPTPEIKDEVERKDEI